MFKESTNEIAIKIAINQFIIDAKTKALHYLLPLCSSRFETCSVELRACYGIQKLLGTHIAHIKPSLDTKSWVKQNKHRL